MYLSGNADADGLLASSAFALLIGMVLDQQVPLERAFAAPYELRERLGDLDVTKIAKMPTERLEAVFAQKPALHRFPAAMAGRVQQVARELVEHYNGDASAVWTSAADGVALLKNVRALPGFGEAKAKIFVALLGKQLGVQPPGWREACAPFGDEGTSFSVADIDRPEALLRVREHKRAAKAAAKSIAGLEATGALTRRPRH